MASFGQNSIGVTTVTTTIWHRGTEVSSVASGGATPKLFPIDLGVEFLRKVSQKPKRLQKNQVDWIYPLVICHIAMERSSHFIANGKPSISMGHRKTMAMLVITRGYIEKNIRFTTFFNMAGLPKTSHGDGWDADPSHGWNPTFDGHGSN
jgi:hypothetical protein